MNVPENFRDRNICIIGMGYVGLTLAVAMAEVGFNVHGIERAPNIVAAICSGKAHFTEPGLTSRLNNQVAAGRLTASLEWPEKNWASVYIITVGTPLGTGHVTNLEAIRVVCSKLSNVLSDHALVILRSTVRVGVSRQFVKPILDGADVPYMLAFCPERTLEGKALHELRTLPQIIGGLDEEAVLRSSQIFNFVTPTTIRVPDLETAEMIKLINNTQRDLMFAFSNEVAAMCDAIGVSVVDVIRAGNMGYSRASMPMPGPVGGPCLEKDPYILFDSIKLHGGEARLSLLGRKINEELPQQTIKLVEQALGDTANVNKIAIIGLAFKGRPETSDLRGTMAIPLIAEVKKFYPSAELVGYDPAISEEYMVDLGLNWATSAADAFAGADCIIFQNNNQKFETLDLDDLSKNMRHGAVIFDLWNQFEAGTMQLSNGVRYFGYGSKVLLNRIPVAN